MPVTDPVADMLTRIRNALGAKHEVIDMPASGTKKAIAGILLKEGYIKGYECKEEGPQGLIRITLKYGGKNESIITGLKKISKPGLRVYAGKDELPKVLGGLGVAIISTSKGIMTDREAREIGVGGEVIAYVW
jgi:small subunit ribosomal protein S8